MDWTDRLPRPLQVTVILLTLFAYVIGLVIGAAILIVGFGALMYLFWSNFLGAA